MNQRGAPPARRPALCPAPSGISCFVLQPHNSAKAFARFSSGRTRRETPQVLPAFVYGFDLVAGPIKIVGRLHLRVSLNGDAAVLQIPVSASAETGRQTRRSSTGWAGARPLSGRSRGLWVAERQGPQGDKGAGSRTGTVCLRRGRTAAASGARRGTRAYARSESAASATASAVKPNSRNSVA